MGVLNVTPDSFSDGGRYLDPDRAVEHALAMEAAGADVIDVGGESSRPVGAIEISVETELERVTPVLERLGKRLRVPVSIDTRRAEVARVALAWLLQRKGVMSVIIGAKSIEQLDDNLAAAELTLTPEEIAKLDEASALKPEYPGWMLARQAEGRVPAAKKA